MSLEWIYGLDELRAYSVDTKQGRERLEAQIKHLPEMLKASEIALPRKPRILCLMAGSCIEGIALAQLYRADVWCLDLQKQMIAKGVKEAQRRHLKVHGVVGDVKTLRRRVGGGFHLVTIIGSPLAHISIYDFDEVLLQIKQVLAENGTFLLDQTDVTFRILPQYRDAFVANLEPPVINVHRRFNPLEGYFERLYYGGDRSGVFKVYLWSPFLIEYMLKKNKFRNIKVTPYFDSYLMMQTTLFAAQK